MTVVIIWLVSYWKFLVCYLQNKCNTNVQWQTIFLRDLLKFHVYWILRITLHDNYVKTMTFDFKLAIILSQSNLILQRVVVIEVASDIAFHKPPWSSEPICFCSCKRLYLEYFTKESDFWIIKSETLQMMKNT